MNTVNFKFKKGKLYRHKKDKVVVRFVREESPTYNLFEIVNFGENRNHILVPTTRTNVPDPDKEYCLHPAPREDFELMDEEIKVTGHISDKLSPSQELENNLNRLEIGEEMNIGFGIQALGVPGGWVLMFQMEERLSDGSHTGIWETTHSQFVPKKDRSQL